MKATSRERVRLAGSAVWYGCSFSDMSTSPRNGVYGFKKMLVKLSQRLSKSDVHQLAYLWGVPEDKAGSALEVFSALEKEGKMSEDNYGILPQSLKDISREDLAKMCQKMMAQQGTANCDCACVRRCVCVYVRPPSVGKSPRAGDKRAPLKHK